MKIGIVAPCSRVPKVEFSLGVQKIKDQGFQVKIHPQVKKADWYFAGTDLERARAFFDFACDPQISVVWGARGGYGAARLLPILDSLTHEFGVPQPKLLVGYSDMTLLMEYVRSRWGWAILHAPLPSMRTFSLLPQSDWDTLSAWIRGETPKTPPWMRKPLQWITPSAGKNLGRNFPIQAMLVGGNLSVLTTLVGTPYAPSVSGCFVFLEDVDESFYRIDRMLQQLLMARFFEGALGILLGNFKNCMDSVPKFLKTHPKGKSGSRAHSAVLLQPKPTALTPLRTHLSQSAVMNRVFGELGAQLGIPVAKGIPAGHGPDVCPLPLGAVYTLHSNGLFELNSWEWLRS